MTSGSHSQQTRKAKASGIQHEDKYYNVSYVARYFNALWQLMRSFDLQLKNAKANPTLFPKYFHFER